jgi:hypothetical protein
MNRSNAESQFSGVFDVLGKGLYPLCRGCPKTITGSSKAFAEALQLWLLHLALRSCAASDVPKHAGIYIYTYILTI